MTQLNAMKCNTPLSVTCDFSGVTYDGLRHRLHRNDATDSCRITVDIFAHKQQKVGWRILCVETEHDSGETRANYIGEIHQRLNDVLSNASHIVNDSGYATNTKQSKEPEPVETAPVTWPLLAYELNGASQQQPVTA